MRFLIDAQLPPGLAYRLNDAGHEALHLHDVMAPETRDIDVALEANRRDAILVTKDEDFVDLSRRGILVAPLLWIRSGNTTNARLWEMLAPLLPTIEQALGTGDKIIEVR